MIIKHSFESCIIGVSKCIQYVYHKHFCFLAFQFFLHQPAGTDRKTDKKERKSPYTFWQFSTSPFVVLILPAENRPGAISSSVCACAHFCCELRENPT